MAGATGTADWGIAAGMTDTLLSRLTRDPRHGQIAAVGSLVLAAVIWFGVEMPWWRPVAGVAAANLTQ